VPRFIVMHKTDAHWEAGAMPPADLIARVSAFLGDLGESGVLLAAEGLRPSSDGVRLMFSGSTRTVVHGPFPPGNELPAGFSIVQTRSLDEAIDWAARQAEALGDLEVDIRPVTEPWDVGIGPKPAAVTTRRYMVLRKATAESEAGDALPLSRREKFSRLIDETAASRVHLVTEHMRPSARGRRYLNSRDGISVMDGPFIESKELIGGYIVVSADSLETAGGMAARYAEVVDAGEVDVRELE
jgi:hypothetical protein